MNPSHGKTVQIRWLMLVISLFTVASFIAACGGGDAVDSDAETASSAVEEGNDDGGGLPTMPAARFAAPTTMIDATKVAGTDGEATPEPGIDPDLAFGEDAYVKLCVECHGATGEGEAGKAETIVGVELEHAAFVDLLRSGGGYGNEHIFGPTKISDDGIVSLLAYVETLSE